MLVSVPTQSLVVSAGLFPAVPRIWAVVWPETQKTAVSGIHVELQHISPPLSSKAMEETSLWQRDPREGYLISPLL